jgi:hypothetical protein
MRCLPTYEMRVYEIPAHDMLTYEMSAYEMPAYEMPTYDVQDMLDLIAEDVKVYPRKIR